MSEQSDLMISWLGVLGKKRPEGCTDMTTELLRDVGYPPVPQKGRTFTEIEAYSYMMEVASICTDTYFKDAFHEREMAKAGGDFSAAERADDTAHFWVGVGAWFKETYT
jgi:hypothetical protein